MRPEWGFHGGRSFPILVPLKGGHLMLHNDAASVSATRSYLTRSKLPQAELTSEVVYLVHADQTVRQEVSEFLHALEMKVIEFSCGAEYLDFDGTDGAACVVLGLNLPDISGLELQLRLPQKGNPPTIFIGDHSDVVSTVRAMKAGAIDFLTRPIDPGALLEAVETAFERDLHARRQKSELVTLENRLATLTPRERDVLPLIVGGLLNKQAASVLGISEVTLQVHRSHAMRKMKAQSVADLVRMTTKLGILSEGEEPGAFRSYRNT
jgi:FixJ family two-component response regulator